MTAPDSQDKTCSYETCGRTAVVVVEGGYPLCERHKTPGVGP